MHFIFLNLPSDLSKCHEALVAKNGSSDVEDFTSIKSFTPSCASSETKPVSSGAFLAGAGAGANVQAKTMAHW